MLFILLQTTGMDFGGLVSVHTICACVCRRANVAVESGVAAAQPVHRGGAGARTQAMAGAA